MATHQLLRSPAWELLDSRILRGDCVDLMRVLPEGSFDAIVTDPPYGLSREPDIVKVLTHWLAGDDYEHRGGGFMGQSWDSFVPGPSVWREAFRVLKPGGHLLAFAGSRTVDLMGIAIRMAGFEIRDSLLWLYGSGLPKSKNLDGDREGWGTALKPAHEPIVVARRPMVGNMIDNVRAYGTGAINVGACKTEIENGNAEGRWPANVILDEEAGKELDRQSGQRPGGGYPAERGDNSIFNKAKGGSSGPRSMGDSGGAARFFFCPKATRIERDLGLGEEFEKRMLQWSSGPQSPGTFQSEGTDKSARNFHPTVKPIELMRWLCRLVTPPGGLILDPFFGSGSTGIAAVMERIAYVGMERDDTFTRIAEARIEHWERYAGAETEAALRSAAARELAKEAGQLGLLEEVGRPT